MLAPDMILNLLIYIFSTCLVSIVFIALFKFFYAWGIRFVAWIIFRVTR